MKPIYEVITDQLTNGQILKKTEADGIIYWIPMDEANSDYQAYLKHLEDNK
jgi:hypothetical protein